MIVGRNVESDLDVVQSVIETVGTDQLLRHLHGRRAAQSVVSRGQTVRRQKVGVMPNRVRRRWVFAEDTFDLDVCSCQEVLGHDVVQHDEAVSGKTGQLIARQHDDDVSEPSCRWLAEFFGLLYKVCPPYL